MAERSQLSRSRLAIIAIASIAAIYGIYTAYQTTATEASPEKTALHRSNAVHRRRSDRTTPDVHITRPVIEAPLGLLTVKRDGHVLLVNLALEPAPTHETVTAAIGPIPEEAFREIQRAIVSSLVANTASLRQMQIPDMRQRLADTPFAGLIPYLESWDPESSGRLRFALFDYMADADPRMVNDAINRSLQDDPSAVDTNNSSANADDQAVAETEDPERLQGAPSEPSQGIKGLLYYIAESQAKRAAYEHRGISCEECNEAPIKGVRYHCLNCADFDLCENCEPHSQHVKTHIFAKIKIPLPVLSQPSKQLPIWYPGDPRKLHVPLNPAEREVLAHAYGFDQPSIDALFDQFTCIANVPNRSNRTRVHAAIDKRAFATALTPSHWPQRYAPNVLYDRMFAFYDDDNNGLIDFDEFVSGMAYLRGPNRFASLERALQGFDVDGDGFVDRSDFLRLFRAKHQLHQQLVRDMVEGQESEQTMAAMDILRSSQPISSVFNQEEIPQGQTRPEGGKQLDVNGDMQPLLGIKAILDDDDPWPEGLQMRRSGRLARSATSRERLHHHLSRFEEMLYSASDQQRVNQRETESVTTPETFEINGHSSYHVTAFGVDTKPIDASSTRGVIQQIAEQGLNETLARMFAVKERRHEDAINTRAERHKWKEEIDQARHAKELFGERLRQASDVDPLMATAKDSYGAIEVDPRRLQRQEPAFTGEILPTDAESLTQRENDIAQQPLEQLLEATGYGTVDGEDATRPHDSGAETSRRLMAMKDERDARQKRQRTSEQPPDPTLPQNRPNASTAECEASSEQRSAPPKDRLVYLASLEAHEREIQERGGPGRFSLAEIEAMVRSDNTRELRGMVTSWLEWASF